MTIKEELVEKRVGTKLSALFLTNNVTCQVLFWYNLYREFKKIGAYLNEYNFG